MELLWTEHNSLPVVNGISLLVLSLHFSRMTQRGFGHLGSLLVVAFSKASLKTLKLCKKCAQIYHLPVSYCLRLGQVLLCLQPNKCTAIHILCTLVLDQPNLSYFISAMRFPSYAIPFPMSLHCRDCMSFSHLFLGLTGL